MAAYDTYTVDSIEDGVSQFNVEKGQVIGKAFELLNYDDFPNESKEFIDEINRRGQTANEMYKLSRHREQMFASGFKAGMYIAKFDENEQLVSFEFTDGTREMLGYDGLEDLPNEFDSWVKTLIPEEIGEALEETKSASLFISDKWCFYNDFVDSPIKEGIVLDKGESVLLKYHYPKKEEHFINCTEKSISVSPMGIDGIYSDAYVVLGVTGAYKGESFIQIVDSKGDVIDEILITVTNETF